MNEKKESKLRCNICGCKFTIQSHKKEQYDNSTEWFCPYCGETVLNTDKQDNTKNK